MSDSEDAEEEWQVQLDQHSRSIILMGLPSDPHACLELGSKGPRLQRGEEFLSRVSCVRAGVEKVQASYSDRFPKFLP